MVDAWLSTSIYPALHARLITFIPFGNGGKFFIYKHQTQRVWTWLAPGETRWNVVQHMFHNPEKGWMFIKTPEKARERSGFVYIFSTDFHGLTQINFASQQRNINVVDWFDKVTITICWFSSCLRVFVFLIPSRLCVFAVMIWFLTLTGCASLLRGYCSGNVYTGKSPKGLMQQRRATPCENESTKLHMSPVRACSFILKVSIVLSFSLLFIVSFRSRFFHRERNLRWCLLPVPTEALRQAQDDT